MSATYANGPRLPAGRHPGVWARALLALLVLTAAVPAFADTAAPEHPARTVHIARQRPPCSSPPGMPIVPNDPGALVTSQGMRCYGTRPAELELHLPEDRYVWLQRNAPNPAAWIDLGPVLVDPLTLEDPPLGLRLTTSDGAWTLETRVGSEATLTRLEPGAWREVTAPDGERFWVLAGATASLSAPPERRTSRRLRAE